MLNIVVSTLKSSQLKLSAYWPFTLYFTIFLFWVIPPAKANQGLRSCTSLMYRPIIKQRCCYSHSTNGRSYSAFHRSPLSCFFSDSRLQRKGHLPLWRGNDPTPAGQLTIDQDPGNIIWNPHIQIPGEPAGMQLSDRAQTIIGNLIGMQQDDPEALWRNGIAAMEQAIHELFYLYDKGQDQFHRMADDHLKGSGGDDSKFSSGTVNPQIAALDAARSRGLVLGASVDARYLVYGKYNTHIQDKRRTERARLVNGNLVPQGELLTPGGMVFWFVRDPRIAAQDLRITSITNFSGFVKGVPKRVDALSAPQCPRLQSRDTACNALLSNGQHFGQGLSEERLQYLRQHGRDVDILN